jgi:hypothetical protein
VKESEMTEQKQTSVKLEQAKRDYVAPQMTDLGSVQQMTQSQVRNDKGGSNCVVIEL